MSLVLGVPKGLGSVPALILTMNNHGIGRIYGVLYLTGGVQGSKYVKYHRLEFLLERVEGFICPVDGAAIGCVYMVEYGWCVPSSRRS